MSNAMKYDQFASGVSWVTANACTSRLRSARTPGSIFSKLVKPLRPVQPSAYLTSPLEATTIFAPS